MSTVRSKSGLSNKSKRSSMDLNQTMNSVKEQAEKSVQNSTILMIHNLQSQNKDSTIGSPTKNDSINGS